MRYLIYSLCFLVTFTLETRGQVVVLNRINFERVNFLDAEEVSKKQYYQTIAYIINDYVKKYYKNDLRIIIDSWDTPYEVVIDNEKKSLVYQLQNKVEKLDYGLFLRIPDSCLSLYKTFNLIDLGFSKKDTMLKCLKYYANSEKWKFFKEECYPSRELIDLFLDKELTKNKNKFIKRIKRKYSLSNVGCISTYK